MCFTDKLTFFGSDPGQPMRALSNASMTGTGDAERVQDSGSGQPKQHPRRIQTVTTLVGGIEHEDVDAALGATYDLPLWKVLFTGGEYPKGMDDVDAMIPTVMHWLDRRDEMGDISSVDPMVEKSFTEIMAMKTKWEDAGASVHDQEHDLKLQVQKLEVAADAMLKRQRIIIASGGKSDCAPEETDIYKVHVKHVNMWKGHKVDLLEKAIRVKKNEVTQLKNDCNAKILGLVHESHKYFLESQPVAGDDPIVRDLMNELENFCIAETEKAWFIYTS